MGHGNTCGACLHAIVPELYLEEDNITVIPYDEIKKQKAENS